jgi:hypothetical protein
MSSLMQANVNSCSSSVSSINGYDHIVVVVDCNHGFRWRYGKKPVQSDIWKLRKRCCCSDIPLFEYVPPRTFGTFPGHIERSKCTYNRVWHVPRTWSWKLNSQRDFSHHVACSPTVTSVDWFSNLSVICGQSSETGYTQDCNSSDGQPVSSCTNC